jgi:hypothetical protein
LSIVLVIAPICHLSAEEWKSEKSTHFIVYYKDAPLEFIEKVIKYAEDYYQQIASNLGFNRYEFWLWENRAKIYIYRDAPDYQFHDKGQPRWSGGEANFQERTIRTYPLAAGFFDSMLPHELGHIIFREFIGFKSIIPLWLDEGVASYQEEARRFGSENQVKKAIKENKFIPLSELSRLDLRESGDTEFISLFYAESVSIVDYLIKRYGKTTFTYFCRSLRDGKGLREALRSNYSFNDLSELNNNWLHYLKYQ